METPIFLAEEGIASAVELLKQESIVALPTETVYGLAGNAFSPKALASIFEAKAFTSSSVNPGPPSSAKFL